MRKVDGLLKIVAVSYLLAGFFGGAWAGDFKLADYKYGDSKTQIQPVDKLPLEGDLTISFDFSLGKDFNSKSSPEYQGLFQTGAGNSGVRIELDSKKATWNLIIGDNATKFSVYDLGKLPKAGVWTKVKIQIIKDTVDLSVNNNKIINSKLESVGFATNSVTIGHGVAPDRDFHGNIRGFIISR